MKTQDLFNNGTRRWVYIGRDPGRNGVLIDTNQYIVIHGGKGMLLDPGGIETFPQVVMAVSREIPIGNIDMLFASHQDPDVISSLGLWRDLNPAMKVYASWVWQSFIPHFGGGLKVDAIPDEGMPLPLGGSNDLTAVPAHYLHSSGNFSLYDPTAKILFTGDIGAALLPPAETGMFVSDFSKHIAYMEGFHRRWMPSNTAKLRWIDRVAKLDVELMCPQHGSIFRREQVPLFLDWFRGLDVGSAAA